MGELDTAVESGGGATAQHGQVVTGLGLAFDRRIVPCFEPTERTLDAFGGAGICEEFSNSV